MGFGLWDVILHVIGGTYLAGAPLVMLLHNLNLTNFVTSYKISTSNITQTSIPLTGPLHISQQA